jgi:selenide,water dikinase
MANHEYVKEELASEGNVPPALAMLLCDPQTSGGLLVAMPRRSAARYLAALKKRGVRGAAVIGEVEAPSGKRLILTGKK